MRLLKYFLHHFKSYLKSALVALIMLIIATAILAAVFAADLVTPLAIVVGALLAVYWIAAALGTITNPVRYALQDWKEDRLRRKGKK